MSTSSSTEAPLTPTELDVTKPRSDPSTLPEPKPHRKRRKVTPAQDLTAGALASSVSRFMIAPLDVLKIRFQIQDHRQKKYTGLRQAIKTIHTEEGLRAFWKGNLAAELMVVPYGAVSFLAYQQFKSTVDHLEILPHTPGWEHILCLSAGSFSGFASTVATYPLDLLRTRLAAQREPKVYRTLSAAFIHIVKHDGIRGLYVGMWPTLVGIVPNMALQFGLYEGMKSTLARFRKLQKHPMQSANVPAVDQSRTSSSSSSSSSLSSDSSSTLSLDIPASSISMSSTPTGDVKTVTTMSLQWGVDVADAHDPHAHPHADRPRPRHHRSSKPFPEMGGAMLTLAVQFGCGFIAGVLSKLLTMPLDVIKKRYQVTGFPLAANSTSLSSLPPIASNATPQQPYKGVWDCGKRIVKYEGIRGLFKGSIPSLIKAGPNSALIFVVYEASLQLFDRLGWKTMH